MRLLFAAIGFLFLLTNTAANSEPLSFTVEQVFLLDSDHSQRRIGEMEFVSGISITADNSDFGGLSDLSVGKNGDLLAITDKGNRVRARLLHDKEGDLVGLADGDIRKLQTTKGRPLKGKKKSDAEGLARSEDGYFVSFEHKHRIWFYADPDPALISAAKLIPPDGLGDMPDNGGLESLVQLGDGRLMTFSEELIANPGETMGWLRTDRVWQPI